MHRRLWRRPVESACIRPAWKGERPARGGLPAQFKALSRAGRMREPLDGDVLRSALFALDRGGISRRSRLDLPARRRAERSPVLDRGLCLARDSSWPPGRAKEAEGSPLDGRPPVNPYRAARPLRRPSESCPARQRQLIIPPSGSACCDELRWAGWQIFKICLRVLGNAAQIGGAN